MQKQIKNDSNIFPVKKRKISHLNKKFNYSDLFLINNVEITVGYLRKERKIYLELLRFLRLMELRKEI